MFSNYNIWKYCSRYFFLLLIGFLVYDKSKSLIYEGSDITGTAFFAGYMTFSIFILKSDISKFIKNLKDQ